MKTKINQVFFIFLTNGIFSEYNRLTSLNLSRTTQGNPYLDSLAVQYLDNQLYILLFLGGWVGKPF